MPTPPSLPTSGIVSNVTPGQIANWYAVNSVVNTIYQTNVGATRTDAFALVQGNTGEVIPVSSSSTVLVTVPSLVQGSRVVLVQVAAGVVSLSLSGTTTVIGAGKSANTAGVGSVMELVWLTSTQVLVRGDLATGSTTTAPVASFTGTPLSGSIPLAVQFTDGSANTPTAWSWTFGDGTTSTQQNPSHTYSSAGTFTVALTVSNAAGSNTQTRASYVTSTTTATVPGVPTSVTGTAGTESATLTWAAPSSNGGSAITGYIAGRNGTDSLGTGPWTSPTPPAAGSLDANARSITFNNLVNGTVYQLSVSAVNAAGTGTAATVNVTPTAAAPVPTQITEAGSPTLVEQANGTSLVVPVPSGTAVGDVLVMQVAFSGSMTGIAVPSGWTLIATETATVSVAAYYRVVTGTEPGSYTFTGVPDGRSTGAMQRFAGVSGGSPLDCAKSSAALSNVGSSIDIPSVTTVTPGAMLISGAVLNASTAATLVAPAGMDVINQIAPNGGRQSTWATELRPTTGATGVRTWAETPTTTLLPMVGWQVALRPASSGGTQTAPSAPTLGTPTLSGSSGSRQAVIPYGLPASNGGSALTQLNASIIPSTGVSFTLHPSLTGTTTTVTGLSDGTTYTYSLTASNAVGTGPSASASFTTLSSTGSTGTAQPTGAPANLKTWTLVFEDHFEGTAIDTTKWNVSDGAPMNKVTTRASNVSVSGSNAYIQLSDSANGGMIHSAILDARGSNKYQFLVNSYTEARVYFPGSGTAIYGWPAWWASSVQTWPASGEHDIAEGFDGTLSVNYHSPSGAHNQGTISGTWSNAYHVYGLHRKGSSADVYWDGVLVKSYATDDNGGPEGLIVNLGYRSNAVIGSAGAVRVDYVRAWT